MTKLAFRDQRDMSYIIIEWYACAHIMQCLERCTMRVDIQGCHSSDIRGSHTLNCNRQYHFDITLLMYAF